MGRGDRIVVLAASLVACGGASAKSDAPPAPRAPAVTPYWPCAPSALSVTFASEVSAPPEDTTAWTVRGCGRHAQYWCTSAGACTPAICFGAAVTPQSFFACPPKGF